MKADPNACLPKTVKVKDVDIVTAIRLLESGFEMFSSDIKRICGLIHAFSKQKAFAAEGEGSKQCLCKEM